MLKFEVFVFMNSWLAALMRPPAAKIQEKNNADPIILKTIIIGLFVWYAVINPIPNPAMHPTAHPCKAP
jgi:hypothetical protein